MGVGEGMERGDWMERGYETGCVTLDASNHETIQCVVFQDCGDDWNAPRQSMSIPHIASSSVHELWPQS